MGLCASKIAPYVDDNRERTLNYISSSSLSVINSLGKLRFTLMNSDALSTTAINVEGLIDFVLVSMYASVITTQEDFTNHFRFCCTLLNHSSAIVIKLCNATVTQEINEKEPELDTSEHMKDLFELAASIQNHPLLEWTRIMKGLIPDKETTAQMFCLFRFYCQALLKYMVHCSNTSELPPQTQYRTRIQKYDPSYTVPRAYVHDYNRVERVLTEISSMCEHVRDNNLAGRRHSQLQQDWQVVPPQRVRRFSPGLSTVNE